MLESIFGAAHIVGSYHPFHLPATFRRFTGNLVVSTTLRYLITDTEDGLGGGTMGSDNTPTLKHPHHDERICEPMFVVTRFRLSLGRPDDRTLCLGV